MKKLELTTDLQMFARKTIPVKNRSKNKLCVLSIFVMALLLTSLLRQMDCTHPPAPFKGPHGTILKRFKHYFLGPIFNRFLASRSCAASLVRVLGVLTILFASTCPSWAKLGIDYQTALGNPTGASTDPLSRTNYLLARSQYALSYNDNTHQANWASWSYSTDDIGANVARTDKFAADTDLPIGYLRISSATFGGDWDRGHICPSEDRIFSIADNEMTFRMSNMMPQAASNNRGLWSSFEAYCRGLAADGSEILIIAGPGGFTGATISNGMAIPNSVWKIIVKIPNASSTVPAASRISPTNRVIAIIAPNTSIGLGPWTDYIVPVEDIEALTGFDFFSSVDASTAVYLKNVVDTGTGPNSPTVITTFSPSSGTPGTTVTLSGYNFGASPTVDFNGATVAGTVIATNQITAVVPAGAQTGSISVTGTGGTDQSYGTFTVFTGLEPIFSLSTFSLSDFSSVEGKVGASKSYTISGSNLSGDILIQAANDFEISLDNSSGSFASSQILAVPLGGTLSGVSVYLRIKSSAVLGAVSGTITHVGGNAPSQSLSVSGMVASGSPKLTLSAATLSGLFAAQGKDGTSKSYAVSGVNLSNSITLTLSSTNFQLSLNNSTFASSQTLTPSNESLSNVPVYVRIGSNAPAGSISGMIVHSGAGITTANLSLLGIVTSSNYLVAWDFNGENNVSTSVAEIFDSGLDSTNELSRGSGASVSSATNSFRTVGFKNEGISVTNTDYFQFTLSATNGKSLSLSGITARLQGTTSFFATPGATNQFAYSTNGTVFTLINSPVVFTSVPGAGATMSVDLSGIPSLQNISANTIVSLRFYASGQTTTGGWGFYSQSAGTFGLAVDGKVSLPPPTITSATSASGTARVSFSYQMTADNSPTLFAASGLPDGLSIDTVTGLISGTTSSAGIYPVTLSASNENGEGTALLTLTILDPVLNLSVSSLSNFSSLVGIPGSSQSYTISGSDLTGAVTLTAPSSFEISSDNHSFSSGTLTLTPSSGSLSAAIYVRLNSSASLGSNSGIITHSGGGALSKNLNVSGTVYQPAITISTASLSGFSTVSGTASSSLSYTVSGSYLTEGITIVASTNYEISADNISFSGSIMLLPAGGTLSNIPVYVRLNIFAPAGSDAGTITHSGGGVADQNLNLSGTVSEPPAGLTLSAATLSGLNTVVRTASSSQSYTVSGHGLTNSVTVAATTNFEISLNNSNYATTQTLNPVQGLLSSAPVFVRQSGTAPLGTNSGSIVHSAQGAAAKSLTLTGTVSEAPPPITSTLSGSIYTNKTFNYTIIAGGTNPITGYNATGLPSWLMVNTTNGVISGTNNSTTSTNLTFTISATSTNGTSSATYRLRVMTLAEQTAIPLNVVINKYRNSSTGDKVELLVIGDSVGDPPVDMRGMILKDFGNNMASDTSGKLVFNNVPLWASVKAGTLIVLSAGTTAAEDLDGSDFKLSVNLGNPTYFTASGGNFDIANTEMVMIKAVDTGVDGVAGGIHALAAGSAGAQYTEFTGKKTRSSTAVSTSKTYGYVLNGTPALSDYYLSSGGANVISSLTFGSGNNSKNTTYINSLRSLDQQGPTFTLAGTNPTTIAFGGTYTDLGATATDPSGGSRTVTTSGSVNTSAVGSYTITYTATDTVGNIGTATRTVNVTDQTAPLVTLNGASIVTVPAGGSFSEAGATATDAVDGSVAVTISGSLNTSVVGTYVLTYSATDAGGNTGTVTRTVNVISGFNYVMANTYGLSGGQAGPTADPDSDGFSNAAEYAFGTSPVQAGSALVNVLAATGGTVKVSYLQKSGVTYTVRSATSLAAGFNGTVTPSLSSPQPSGLPSGYSQYEAAFTPGADKGFLKVEAVVP